MKVVLEATPDGAIVMREATVYPVELYSDEHTREFEETNTIPAAIPREITTAAGSRASSRLALRHSMVAGTSSTFAAGPASIAITSSGSGRVTGSTSHSGLQRATCEKAQFLGAYGRISPLIFQFVADTCFSTPAD